MDIVDHRTDGTEVLDKDAFIISKNGGRRKRETTKGWELLVKWMDGSTSWETLKDMKECFIAEGIKFHLILPFNHSANAAG